LPERFVVAMEFAAAVAQQSPARGRRKQIAKRIDAVLQRHRPTLQVKMPGTRPGIMTNLSWV
jgi:hypothetical protein